MDKPFGLTGGRPTTLREVAAERQALIEFGAGLGLTPAQVDAARRARYCWPSHVEMLAGGRGYDPAELRERLRHG